MNHRSVPRIGRLLCGLATALMLGLLAAPASAQLSDSSAVTFTASDFFEFVFLDTPGTSIAIVAPDGGLGGLYEGTRNWRVRANRGWKFTGNSFSGWSPALPAGWDYLSFGNPSSSLVGGEFLGTLTARVFRISGPVVFLAPATYTGTVTITIGPNP